MSLLNEPTLPERQRPQEPNHIRTIEVQVLDALLRMEELIQQLVDQGATVTRVDDEVQIELPAGAVIDTSPGGVTMVDTKPVASPVKRKPNPKTL